MYRNSIRHRFTSVTMLVTLLSVAVLLSSPALAVPPAAIANTVPGIQVEKIRKQLATLTNYGVFDDLNFTYDGSSVTLTGYASRPTLKSDAQRAVASIESVNTVVNKIEVLPLSPMDDQIRFKTYLAIYRNPNLRKYSSGGPFMPRLTPMWMAGGITNNPPIGWHPIHIIVKNGNVTLTGIVDRDMDRTIAGMAANRVPGVFSVTNDLAVAIAETKQDNTRKTAS